MRLVKLEVVIDLDAPLGPQVAAAKPFIGWKLLEDMTGMSRQHLDRLRVTTRKWASGVVVMGPVDVFVNDAERRDA